MRRIVGEVSAALAVAAFAAGTVTAQQYPAKPIRMIVPFAPGGPNDVIGRIIGQKLTEAWGQSVVIENRGGAGGTIGVDMGAKAPADGYTIIMGGSSNLAVAPSLYAKLPYDPLHDLVPISNVAIVPYVVTVNPGVPARNMRELVAIAKTKPKFLSYGSSGTGSMSSLAAELIKSTSGINIIHVPYKGTAPAVTDNRGYLGRVRRDHPFRHREIRQSHQGGRHQGGSVRGYRQAACSSC